MRKKAAKMEILTYILAVWQNSEIGPRMAKKGRERYFRDISPEFGL